VVSLVCYVGRTWRCFHQPNSRPWAAGAAAGVLRHDRNLCLEDSARHGPTLLPRGTVSPPLNRVLARSCRVGYGTR